MRRSEHFMDRYREFEDLYRGSLELIRARQSVYLPIVGKIEPGGAGRCALDIGCGRGEWVKLLVEQGWQAVGVDSNPSMVAIAASQGLPVLNRDAFDHLRGCGTSSIGLVTAFHVVEHMDTQALADLLAEIERVLMPGGVVILETPNPENLSVASWSFRLDPTHEVPLPPPLLQFFVQTAGFQRPTILRLNSQSTSAEGAPVGSAVVGLFMNSPDYSVIASKPGANDGIADAIAQLVAERTEPSPADIFALAAEIQSFAAAAAKTDALASASEHLLTVTQTLSAQVAQLHQAKEQLHADVAALGKDVSAAREGLSAVDSLSHHFDALHRAKDNIAANVEALAARLTEVEGLRADVSELWKSGVQLRDHLDAQANRLATVAEDLAGLNRQIATAIGALDQKTRQHADALEQRLNHQVAIGLAKLEQRQDAAQADLLAMRVQLKEVRNLALLKLLVKARRARKSAKRKIKEAFQRQSPLRATLRRIDRVISAPFRHVRNRIWPRRRTALVAPALLADNPSGAVPAILTQSSGERLAVQRLSYALELARAPREADRPAGAKPRLAFVSPLPPERSGIADYSAQILPELAKYYDIDAIVAQETVADNVAQTCLAIRSVEWFEANANQYDRILYHFGNSPFHSHMFSLLYKIPGIVVLHDFYLSDIICHLEMSGEKRHFWTNALVTSHGYSAVKDRFYNGDIRDTIRKYPVNFDVLTQSQGVIVHSNYPRELAVRFYPKADIRTWRVIPLVRYSESIGTKAEARRALGLSDDDIVVCSFGFVHESKLSHRLLDAWLQSDIGRDGRCRLFLVGELLHEHYADEIRRRVDALREDGRVRATGFVSGEDYRLYLRAADIGVQLRAASRGETSAAALDCLTYGLATIVNANGSMAELPDSCTVKLENTFDTSELAAVLTRLCTDAVERARLGRLAAEHIADHHNSALVAQRYHEAIERFSSAAPILQSLPALMHEARQMATHPTFDDAAVYRRAERLCAEARLQRPCRRLFVDVSVLAVADIRTGIQRVVRALLLELLRAPPEGYRIEPVHLSDVSARWRYYYARRYMEQVFTGTPEILTDEPIEVAEGDVFLGADFHSGGIVEANIAGIFREWRERGVRIGFVVYDILPLTLPQCFPSFAETGHRRWIQTIAEIADDLVCISASVAYETRRWLATQANTRGRLPAIHSWTLGADIDASHPSKGIPADAEALIERMRSTDCFLMVGTIEPRKGHLQALDAFDLLWARGSQSLLIIVGNEGWRGVARDQAQNLPDILDRLSSHPERGRRLIWIQGASDEFLDRIYQEADCLIAASLDEGFGLPLIEAARHGVPVLARDIPVFREVAGEAAAYFSGSDRAALAQAIEDWLEAFRADRHPKSSAMKWRTWAESTALLKEILFAGS
ncbi:glycosyltransferase [Xanthobacter sp. KR7-225]|uniref:glycosyltransferase n=1 Tax=Xanthobacter sp. KR7-225 TaxID=3156613 RepID=UPI0032B31DEF